jgi:nucleoside-diphosphate-sugar epimerase
VVTGLSGNIGSALLRRALSRPQGTDDLDLVGVCRRPPAPEGIYAGVEWVQFDLAAQVLPAPEHFEQASTLVTEEMVAQAVVFGDDVDVHVEQLRQYVDAGYDEVYVQQIGPDQKPFFGFYADEVLPRLRKG